MRKLSLLISILLLIPNIAYAQETKASVSKEYKINWSEYNPNLYNKIKIFEKNRNCRELQNLFDLAVINNKAHSRQYGHNNVNLMRYIDQVLRRAKCYR